MPGDGQIVDGTGPPPIDGGIAIGPLRVDLQNPRYFTTGNGKALYLTGRTRGATSRTARTSTHHRRSTIQPFSISRRAPPQLLPALDLEQPHSFDDDANNLLYFGQFPYQRTGPGNASDGKLKFNLDMFDDAYFTRMHDRIAAARGRGIYVAVMLFDGWDLTNAYNPSTGGFPMGRATTSTASRRRLGGAQPGGQHHHRAPEGVHPPRDRHVNDLDNVLYEIANETDASAVAWQYDMIDFVKMVEASKPKQHPVG